MSPGLIDGRDSWGLSVQYGKQTKTRSERETATPLGLRVRELRDLNQQVRPDRPETFGHIVPSSRGELPRKHRLRPRVRGLAMSSARGDQGQRSCQQRHDNQSNNDLR